MQTCFAVVYLPTKLYEVTYLKCTALGNKITLSYILYKSDKCLPVLELVHMEMAWRSKNKDWLTQNQDNIICSIGETCGPVSVSQHYENPTKRVGLVQSGHQYYLIEYNLFLPGYSWKMAHLLLNNNHSFFDRLVWVIIVTSINFSATSPYNLSILSPVFKGHHLTICPYCHLYLKVITLQSVHTVTCI